MPSLKLLYIGRSDGTLSTTIPKSKRQESNGPTKDQLEKRRGDNGVYSYYQELTIEDAKSIDWRKKLGGLLVREVTKALKAQGKDISKPSKKDFSHRISLTNGPRSVRGARVGF